MKTVILWVNIALILTGVECHQCDVSKFLRLLWSKEYIK